MKSITFEPREDGGGIYRFHASVFGEPVSLIAYSLEPGDTEPIVWWMDAQERPTDVRLAYAAEDRFGVADAER